MEAMILAAGLGTRLRPLTDDLPKALVPVGNVPILERVARRLVSAGADNLVINVHHHADKIRAFVEERNGFGVTVSISEEPEEPLDTGGGLKNAARFFRGKTDFLLHNVDVLSDLDFRGMIERHRRSGAIATLAVRESAGDRYLLVDDQGRLAGYGSTGSGDTITAASRGRDLRRVDFLGIQVLRPDFLGQVSEVGIFSIIYVYFRLANAGIPVLTLDASDSWWIDIGTHESLEEARLHLAANGAL